MYNFFVKITRQFDKPFLFYKVVSEKRYKVHFWFHYKSNETKSETSFSLICKLHEDLFEKFATYFMNIR